MKVLLLGSGGREHAIAWKLAQSPKLEKLFIAPGNAGTADEGTNVDLNVNDHNAVKEFVLKENINMLIVGPEAPLVAGIHDFFLNDEDLKNVGVIGPQSQAAMLEGSKNFAKEFMQRHDIPTASYKTFNADSLADGLKYLESLKPPYVLKADGLAAGKGVLICQSLAEAKAELNSMIADSKFGDASSKVVIEEFLSGVELSVFVLTDGDSYKILPVAKDYKRIGEGDTGLNTGGMGSISHVPFADDEFMKKVEDHIIKPTIDGLKSENIPYKGFVFFGLINVNNDPFVIEYNVRMGDPEAESVIPRIKSDLLDLFSGVANNNLHEKEIETDERYTAAIMLVSGGYPGSYEKGKEISGLDKMEDCIIFHAGTKLDSNKVVTNGGRVLAVTSYGKTMDEALEKSYKNAAKIKFDGSYYRSDLGFDIK
ncbi:MAG: phosphoribosylamine--glycine ligase [Bacteroidales bacterium]|nr:phosphoribosylamine--glycine ligase [Bacteroidales bacterium]